MGPTRIPWAVPGPDPADAAWRHDRHHPLLGRNLPPVLVPDWPEIAVVPSHQLNQLNPTGFRSYTRLEGGEILCDYGDSWESSKFNLRQTVERRDG